MSEAKPWQSFVDVAILHPTRAQILAQASGTGLVLPSLPLPQVWAVPLAHVQEAVQRQFGLETTVLHKVAEVREEANRLVYILYLLENHASDWTPPPDATWIGVAELDQVTFTKPAHQAAITTWLGQLDRGLVPPLRANWAQLGWYATATAWIHRQLDTLGYRATAPVHQIKNWFLSCVLAVPTAHGTLYFKATNSSSLMVNEAQMTQALARLFPHVMPKPLAIEPAQDWMLLADFGDPIEWDAPIAVREAVLQAFGHLQRATATRVDELLALGCIDRRLDRLAQQVEPLLNDTTMLAYVNPDQQAQLQAAIPRLQALCTQLAAYQVPSTLVHGDLHMNNVARASATDSQEDYLFFDWSDACITHPFLDMISILHEPDPARQLQLRDSYLALWTDYEPIDRLHAMWKLAYPLCALHQAVSYQQILHNTEAACQYELDWAMPFWFGKILEALPATPVV